MSLDPKSTICFYDHQNRCVVDMNTFLYEGEEKCIESGRLSILAMFKQQTPSTAKDSGSVFASKTFCFPRSKMIPKAKPKTRWERFAEKKGIVKKKKSHLTWNETRKEWVPRFGGRSSEIRQEEDWCVELN